MTTMRRLYIVTAASTLAITSATSASTQSAPAAIGASDNSSAANPADIIVTARRTEERLQDVPISITVYNQQQLANRNITTAADLATYTPSLETNNFFGATKAQFSIRGFVQDIGTQPSVGVYFADVVAPSAGSISVPTGDGAGPGNLFDLANVQVLKGPQGTLFGRNTTGGAVLLVPQKPTDKLEGYLEGSYGNYDSKRIQGVFNTPLGDKARFRIGVDHMERDGYLKNDSGIGPSRLDNVDYTAVRASLVVDLTPDLENYIIASYTRSKSHGEVQKLAACNPAVALGLLGCAQLAAEKAKGAGFFTAESILPQVFDNQTQWQIINTTTWRASDSVTVKNIISYAQLSERYSSSLFGTSLDTSLLVPTNPVGTNILLNSIQAAPGHDNSDESTLTEEFRLQGQSLGGRLTWQGGGYLEVSEPLSSSGVVSQTLVNCSSINGLICNNPLGAGGVVNQLSRTSLHDVGLYAQGTYSLTDRLKLTGGFRYTWDRVKSNTSLQSYGFAFGANQAPPNSLTCEEPNLTLPDCLVRPREKSSKPTWLIDIDYKPTSRILLYAKYARGYRAGNIIQNAPAQYTSFKPESVDSYEVGVKSSLGGALKPTLDVAAFYNNFSDQQLIVVFDPKPGENVPIISGITNAGKSRIGGVEASGAITPFQGFTLDASYTYLNTKLRDVTLAATSPDSPYELGASERPGDPLTFAPKNKVTVTGTYKLPLDTSIGDVSIGATYVHVDRMLTNYSSRDAAGKLSGFSYVSPRNLLNLNATWDGIAGTNIDLALFATNVLQKKYYSVYAPLISSVGFTSGTVGEPRMYGLRLRYSFGR